MRFFIYGSTALLISVIFLFAVPSVRIGGASIGAALVSVSENAIASGSRSEYFSVDDVEEAASDADALEQALCRQDGPNSAADWFSGALARVGVDAERRATQGGGAFVHGVIRAGSGAAGTATLVFSSAAPSRAVGVWGADGASRDDICGDVTASAGSRSAPHGALIVLALARALAAAKWRGSDFSFVFYFDSNSSSDLPACLRSEDDGAGGAAGQAGCWGGGATSRGKSVSPALRAWTRAAAADPWRDAFTAPAIAAA
jgi:hypothetical protein